MMCDIGMKRLLLKIFFWAIVIFLTNFALQENKPVLELKNTEKKVCQNM